jgi:predicted HAD superfamily Cof-like phosphohydrolase
MNNKTKYEKVTELHKLFGSPYSDSPQILGGAGDSINKQFAEVLDSISKTMKLLSGYGDGRQVLARGSWILEELSEFFKADTLEDQADALTDINYFVEGTFVEMGLEPDNLFDIVHQANLNKVGEDGLPKFNEQGKWIKPPNWEAPEPKLREEIKRQIRAASTK